MKTKYCLFFLLLFLFVSFSLFKITEKREIFIQFTEIPPDMYVKYFFSDNDSNNVKQIEFGNNNRGIESWLIEINENKIKNVNKEYLKNKLVCSQGWFSLNYTDLNKKDKLVNRNKIFIVWKTNKGTFLLPVKKISTVFYD